MTSVSSTTASTASQTLTAAGSSVAGDMQSFLRLLVAQLQNQDPLQPVDSTQFVTQLAMFAQAEQGVNTNTKLDTIVGMVQGQMLSGSSHLLGKSVMVPSDTVAFDGASPVRLSYTVPSDAGTVRLEITDATGRVVRSVEGAAASGAYDDAWDGRTDDGAAAPAGTYTVRVTAEVAGGADGTTTTQALDTTIMGRVDEIRVQDNGVVAVVAGKEIPVDKISGVAG
jgi:flagellar basal-body rod modification protein FlgD